MTGVNTCQADLFTVITVWSVFIARATAKGNVTMSIMKQPIDVGAPQPDLQTSPILSDFDDEREMIEAQIPEERLCHFNGVIYPHGTHIKSGTLILECDRGAWVESESIESL